jgi:ubiquinone/menaquinone biosynthesis C-methylase UbiE
MAEHRVDYDQLAPDYDRRYIATSSLDRGRVLLALAEALKATRILEVGCGTCHWLAAMAQAGLSPYGLDLSSGMLLQAHLHNPVLPLAQGYARHLPYADGSFDLVMCVNSIHHFSDARSFVKDAFRTLRPGGTLAIVGSDPHGQHYRWYVYDYFEGTYDTDLERFPPWDTVCTWAEAAGFTDLQLVPVEHIQARHTAWEVFHDPFLHKNACSQLALLSDKAYEVGLRRIRQAITQADARGKTIVFETDFKVFLLTGYRGSG